jgi:hypothetical protein
MLIALIAAFVVSGYALAALVWLMIVAASRADAKAPAGAAEDQDTQRSAAGQMIRKSQVEHAA